MWITQNLHIRAKSHHAFSAERMFVVVKSVDLYDIHVCSMVYPTHGDFMSIYCHKCQRSIFIYYYYYYIYIFFMCSIYV